MKGFIRNFSEIAQQWLAMAWTSLQQRIRPKVLGSKGCSTSQDNASDRTRQRRRWVAYAVLIGALGAMAVRFFAPSDTERLATVDASDRWLGQYQALQARLASGGVTAQEIESLEIQPGALLRSRLKQHLQASDVYGRQLSFPADMGSLVTGDVLRSVAPDEKDAYVAALLTEWRGHIFSGDIASAGELSAYFEVQQAAMQLKQSERLVIMALNLQLAMLDPQGKVRGSDVRRRLAAEMEALPDSFGSVTAVEAHIAAIEAAIFAGDIVDARQRLARLMQWSASSKGAAGDALRVRLAEAAMALGRYADARAVLQHLQAPARQTPSCARSLEYWQMQAELAVHEGQVDQAEQMLSKIEACFASRQNGQHLQVARMHNSRGLLHLLLAQPDQALQAFGAARDAWASLLSERHVWVGHAHNNLGAAYRLKGDLASARQQFEMAGSLWTDVLGATHPLIVIYNNNVAELEMLEAVDPSSVEARLTAALETRRVYGEQHPWIAVVLGNLGELASMQGRLDEALKHHSAALDIREAAHGEWHPDTALSLNNLGSVQFRMGEMRLAMQSFERSRAVLKKMLGETSPRTTVVMANLVATQVALEDFANAEALLVRLAEIEAGRGAEGLASSAAVLVRLGDVRRRLGTLPEAERAYLAALDAIASMEEDSRPKDTARNALSGLKAVFRDLGKRLPKGGVESLAPWWKERV